MYQASTQYDTAILEDGRTFRAKITIGTEEITDGFRSIKQSARSCGSDYITIGGAVSSCVEVEMWAPSVQLKNQEFDLSIGLVVEGGTEWVPIGKFTAPDPKDNDGILTFAAYDRIWSKMSGAYFSELTYPADGKAALAEMAAKTGVPIKTDNLPDGVMIPKREVVSEATVDEEGNETTNITYTTPFDGYTYREALGYIAQFYGKIATANRSGEVELRWYTETDCELRANQYYDDLIKSEQIFSVNSIVCQVGNSTLKVGTGVESIGIENPVMTQERLQAVYDQVKDLQYLPASLSFFGDPRLDLCDIVKVYDKAGNLIRLPVMRLAQDFDGGLITQLQSFVGTEQESAQQKGPTAQALDRTYSELFLVKELIGNKASFEYIQANCVSINLANIDIAHINQAKINDLYAATGLIKHVVISEGQVTDFLDAVQVNAASITAGTLIADRILLRGSNQSLVYALNNFGELTSTQVNTIDGYVLTDRTINADKIIAHSITANEITVENLIGANGWINLAQGTFNYGDALIWDGSRLTVNGVVDTDALTATGGTIGGWLISDTRLMSANASIGSGGACLFLINESSKPFIAAQNEDSAVTFQLARNGKLTATDATITGAITATSLTAKNTYYIHNSSGTKKVAMTAPDASFGSSLDIGTGFTAVHINGRVITGMELIVGEDLTGSIQCGAIITNVGIRTYNNVNRIPIGSDNPDKYRVAQIASYTSSINIWAQWGVEGASYTARSLSVPSSDIRLKDNVQQSEVDALSVINQIQMRQFDWKDHKEHWDVGFVADELEQIDPLLSIGGGTDDDGNPMYKSVNDFYLLGYLTKAVQELSAENARLKKRVSHLEAA